MEDLNKNQIILLTLLISFVTSIAAGIITASLLQQAPLEVTRNINSIVEKTIETVTTPGTAISLPQQKEVTTVVVKEEDSIISSIDKNIKSLVRIREKNNTTDTDNFYGMGLIVTKDGIISAPRNSIVPNDVYTAIMNDGTEIGLSPTGIDKNTDVILFRAVLSGKQTYPFVPATFSNIEPKLGQTLISLGGDKLNTSSVGRVSLLTTKDNTIGTTTTKSLSGINLDNSSNDLVDGSPLINLSGDIVGINLSPDNTKSFVPIVIIKNEIGDLITILSKTQ